MSAHTAQFWSLILRIALMGLVLVVCLSRARRRPMDALLVGAAATGAVLISILGYVGLKDWGVAVSGVNAGLYALVFLRFLLRK